MSTVCSYASICLLCVLNASCCLESLVFFTEVTSHTYTQTSVCSHTCAQTSLYSQTYAQTSMYPAKIHTCRFCVPLCETLLHKCTISIFCSIFVDENQYLCMCVSLPPHPLSTVIITLFLLYISISLCVFSYHLII